MLSLFQILTLENWPQYLDAGQAIHPVLRDQRSRPVKSSRGTAAPDHSFITT